MTPCQHGYKDADKQHLFRSESDMNVCQHPKRYITKKAENHNQKGAE